MTDVIALAKTLATCKDRVRAFNYQNINYRSAEEAAKSGAIYELALTALEKAQREYDHAVKNLTADEVIALGMKV